MKDDNEKSDDIINLSNMSYQDLYTHYLIEELNNKTIYFSNMEKKYRYNSDIIKTERQLGIRRVIRKGYDVFFNRFFVEEIVLFKNYLDEINEKELLTFFYDFAAYYGFLQGDIYQNACYYKCNFSQYEISNFLIDLNKMNFTSFINYDIEDFSNEFFKNNIKQFYNLSNLEYETKKFYDNIKNCFIVEQKWKDKTGKVISEYCHTFKYFFDFVHFLKSDLSDTDLSKADLICYDALQNIKKFSELNFTNAKLENNFLVKFNLTFKLGIENVVGCYSTIQNNSVETIKSFTPDRGFLSLIETLNCQTIYYISDLHLMHRISNANCKNFKCIQEKVQEIINSLLNCIRRGDESSYLIGGYSYTVLIGGDISSDFQLFKLFVNMLKKSIDEDELDVKVIFTLGNHEFWDYEGMSIDEVIYTYKKIINDNDMYLLQNNILFIDDKARYNIEEISSDELKSLSKDALKSRLMRARLILFGGVGFSGYNGEFNANQFIYRNALNRQQEIEESKKFEELYKKICADLSDKRVVVFTHMPQIDWCSQNEPHKGFVYVNGHTHRNYFYDDGDYRIYADNQIGYHQENCHLKYFYLDDDYDIFENYEDGIFEITKEAYIDFHRGKNIAMDFYREGYNIFMLKKNSVYCFIAKNKKGYLLILNGGNLKRLDCKDLNYYYENMDKVISYIKTPLDNFSNYQKQIADEIKAIGGSGNIHGAIIDIDFFNHLYVNPVDLTVTAYWASDIVNKVIFEDTPALLQSNCPNIYANYLKQIESKSETALVLNKSSIVKPAQLYLDTDIYRASREIKKLQKLSSNILSVWIEPEAKKLSDNND